MQPNSSAWLWERRCPVKHRLVATAVVALAVLAGGLGCSRTETVPPKTARITVDGNTRTSHAVSCTQVEWLVTVDIGAAPGNVQAMLRLGSDDPKAESVNINNVDGFTGLADAGVGKAEATFTNGTYRITGTAQGTNTEDPSTPKTADFKIETQC
ncbi:lipoprotein LpqH [Mycobacterium heckeshornense]|uniref:lipoprotein LpqH n=1 Tax=Mycobacterium heckeshornense TaxID=110505 RepID=UPI0006622CE2|nr:lipoprotein LpqH [Mycobacterium heckeshornense]